MISDLIVLLVYYPWILEKVRRLLGIRIEAPLREAPHEGVLPNLS